MGGSTSIKPDSNSLGTDLSYKPSTQMIRAAFLLPGATLSGKKVVISSKNMANPQLLGFHCILAPVFLAPVFPIKDHGFGQSTPKQPPHPRLGSHSLACLLLPWSPWLNLLNSTRGQEPAHWRGFYEDEEARSHGKRMGHTGKTTVGI